MNRQKLLVGVAVTAVLLLELVTGLATAQAPDGGAGSSAAMALGTAFTYQGHFIKDGTPANGTCDLRFTLFDAGIYGSPVGTPVEKLAVPVTGGLFTVPGLDFGSAAFAGEARWLQVEVRCPPDTNYVVVGDRQALTATPYALYAAGNWGLSGNANTTPGPNFLGTTDDRALELKVNGQRALRIEPNTNGPNLIGGYISNTVSAGVLGATIAGGGEPGSACGLGVDPCWNRVTANYGTVGGGAANTTSFLAATVGGGYSNTASKQYATVGGGGFNTASGFAATVPGGGGNTGGGDFSFAAGRRAQATNQGSFVWADSTDADFSSTANNQFAVRASGGVTLVVGSGGWHIEPDPTSPNLIGGSLNNMVDAGVYGATIAGGGEAVATCGVLHNDPCWNRVLSNYGTVGGGGANVASSLATVGGGSTNNASGAYAAIAGGYFNTASGWWGAVGGGSTNTASGDQATVGGGASNVASGENATVPGGYANTADGSYSFAAGRQAKADYPGSFVWGDSTNADISSTGANQFIVRAVGGITMYTNSGLTAGVSVAAGGGSWSSVSDRALKENSAAVDGQALLDRLARVPVTTWNYKSQDAAIRHIGPMAQDFYAAFGVGEDDTHISTIDADGVALAASQGLYRLVQEQASQIAALQSQNAALKAEVASQRQENSDQDVRLAALEARAGGGAALVAGRLGLLGLAAAGLAVGAVLTRRGGGR